MFTMGKKKNKTEKPSRTEQFEPKTQKSYSYTSDGKSSSLRQDAAEDKLPKVQIAAKLEAAILDVILERKKAQNRSGSASFRMTSKKLTDMYTSLNHTGFKHSQIEAAMANTVPYGGDLMDALDWLCLNTPNDQLPDGFSQSLAEVDIKRRPHFKRDEQKMCRNLVREPAAAEGVSTQDNNQGHEAEVSSTGDVKDWILEYADQSDDDDLDELGQVKVNPNSRYLELSAMLLDVRETASQAKASGDKSKAKACGRDIQKYMHEMSELEQSPEFNPAIKISDIDLDTRQEVTSPVTKATSKTSTSSQSEESSLGLDMLEEQAAAEKPKAATTPEKQVYRKKTFTYTRQQWTGKSPKQFLIDWVRKHLPKSPPPSYKHVQTGGNLWRSRVLVVRAEGDLDVLPQDIVCENVKEAEHLASTLALYGLCQGQRVYQLLPPPYREVWLEWQDAEDSVKHHAKVEQNKPRDQLVTRLMKQLRVDTVEAPPGEQSDSDVEDTWENLDSDEDFAQFDTTPKQPSGPTNEKFQSLLERNQSGARYGELLGVRKKLPVYTYRDRILDTVRKHNTVVIAGETGSGKSTQIPQFLLQDLVSSGQVVEGGIVCTQPRRISAISLSTRVCDELGESKPGKPNGLCGYQIRFESKKTDTTRLTYCTTGVLLRQLQQDPELKHITHFIVDEVHERSVQSDFLLILLRRLLERRRDMKLVLMSATVDAHKFSAYFSHCPVIEIPGRTHPVKVHHLEDVLEMTGYTLDSGSTYSLRQDQLVQEEQSRVSVTGKGGHVTTQTVDWSKQDIYSIDMSDLDPGQYSLKTRNTVTRMSRKRVNLELIVDLIAHLDKEGDYVSVRGAILVFLPGLVQIQDLYDNLKSDHRFADHKSYQILALHSVLSSDDQNAAFTVPPSGVRKIVIATNIAETGITIPDVVFVIDSGKVKENRYVESSQLSSLEEVYVSQASARQRQGRAGRVRPGTCFRLYALQQYKELKPYSVPEIYRVPLEELCLHIMKCELGSPAEFLAQALDPPKQQAVSRALSILREVEAVEPNDLTLTPLGHHLAALPVNVRVGKMLVYSAIFSCLQPMAVIAATLTEKSPFTAPMGKRQEADAAKHSIALANSDHLTLLKAFLMWQSARCKGNAAEMEFCNTFYMKRNTLVEINNIALDLIKLVNSAGFGSTDDGQSVTSITFTAEQLSGKMAATIKAVLTAGLYPNVAQVEYSPKVDSVANPERNVCTATTSQGALQVHPASVNRFLAANGWLVYHEKMKLGRAYLRDSSLVSLYPLLLFGGDIDVQHQDQVITIDNWIQLQAYAKTAVIFKELRKLISWLLADKLEKPKLSLQDDPVIRIIQELIQTERVR